MILDTQETFSAAQNAFSAGTDVVSTNVYDTGAAADVGAGEPFYIYAKVNTAFSGGTSIQVVLQDSADNSSFADVQSAKAIPVASASANAELCRMRIPVGVRRYLRLAYRSVGTTTAGSVSAYIVKDVQAQQYAPSGFTVQ